MRHGFFFCCLILTAASVAFPQSPHVYVLTDDANGGSSDVLQTESPWSATQDVEATSGDAVVRHFYGLHYVVHRSDSLIQIVDATSFDTIDTFSVGAGSTPHDILVVAPDRAYVSRYDSALLHEVDPTRGRLVDTIDLGGLADADGLPEMSMMALDGNRLFVQIQRIDRAVTFNPVPPSYLAVVDIRTNTPIDVDPSLPGTQGVTLNGTIPSFRMQVDPIERRLYVSTPGRRNEFTGGIEEIDLDTLQSLGFVYSEERASVDLGGFVMVGADRGYVIGHTDIVESSHLTAFHRDPEAPGQGEIHTSLFVHNDHLAHDAPTDQLFYPDATAGPPGIHVFDTLTSARLTDPAVATGKPPVDLVVARASTPGEAIDLRVSGYDNVSETLSLTYGQSCAATNHNIVFGPLQDVAGHGYSGQVCGIGTSGSFDGFSPGTGSFFFVLVGTDGAGREGSYGLASGGERPEDTGDPDCTFDQDLTARCDL